MTNHPRSPRAKFKVPSVPLQSKQSKEWFVHSYYRSRIKDWATLVYQSHLHYVYLRTGKNGTHYYAERSKRGKQAVTRYFARNWPRLFTRSALKSILEAGR